MTQKPNVPWDPHFSQRPDPEFIANVGSDYSVYLDREDDRVYVSYFADGDPHWTRHRASSANKLDHWRIKKTPDLMCVLYKVEAEVNSTKET